ncbi:2'-5' RNA ligase [Legionella santicrucis]|uniref:RNA 2',3'-cyclic phosphodiesterase n=1 Tax=Legionella santicrucis TaxID=45074 RepID=A0A0W0ZBW5_9GAMM|nr:RNA 2',3'-cyclic phosphodiesterase [Legionella santicrucis]KTD66628.1 2'-5' RNA ligase [Legionella santicrucis]
MNTIRAFFAIVPSKEIRLHLLNILQSLKQDMPEDYIRWVDIENLHITLHFIAQFQLKDMALVNKKISNVLKHIPCFQLKLGPVEWFPTLRHPKVLSLIVEPHDLLSKLVSIITHALHFLNYPIESRPFRGHMTLARVRHHQHQKLLSQIKLGYIPPITVDKIYLIESKLGQGRSTYTTLTEFQLI